MKKLALIDRRIIWFGSLNIMSHKNSKRLDVAHDTSAGNDQAAYSLLPI